jgi:hypothetical protein
MANPDSYTDNEGIREIDVTIYDDYPIYLMENAWDMQSIDDQADAASSGSNSPSNKFNSNEFFWADIFKAANPPAPKPRPGDTSSRGQPKLGGS